MTQLFVGVERSVSRRCTSLLILVLTFLLVGARWIWSYRRGQPFDIDEAGFLGIALSNYDALAKLGVAGWFRSVLAPSIQAPLTTASASLLFQLTGPHTITAFTVPMLAGVGCIIATHDLGKLLGSRGIAMPAAILVASTPVIINYSRSFHFAVPATLVFRH